MREMNLFGPSQTADKPGNALAQSDQSRSIAEVQAAMMIARMNPRNQIAAMNRILNAFSRPTLADVAVYTYARGDSNVSGPSIRAAEAIAQNWGNISFGIRELEQRNGESTVQAFAWDMETNTRREVAFQVPHVRHTKTGQKRLEDPRDIYEMVANQGARRLRACILAVIPGDVIESAVRQAEITMSTSADTSPEATKKMLAAFDAFGISKEQIEKRIQRRIDAIQPAQVAALKKIYASLRDGISAPGDWFETAEVEPPAKPAYTLEQFNANIAKWRDLIASGRKSADDIIAMVESKSRLSDAQKAAIRADTETGEVEPPPIDSEWMASYSVQEDLK